MLREPEIFVSTIFQFISVFNDTFDLRGSNLLSNVSQMSSEV